MNYILTAHENCAFVGICFWHFNEKLPNSNVFSCWWNHFRQESVHNNPWSLCMCFVKAVGELRALTSLFLEWRKKKHHANCYCRCSCDLNGRKTNNTNQFLVGCGQIDRIVRFEQRFGVFLERGSLLWVVNHFLCIKFCIIQISSTFDQVIAIAFTSILTMMMMTKCRTFQSISSLIQPASQS